MDLELLKEFLGWCAFINSCLLVLSSVVIMGFKEKVLATHHKLFSIPRADLLKAYFYYLGFYKILIIVFNITPYIALNFMLN